MFKLTLEPEHVSSLLQNGIADVKTGEGNWRVSLRLYLRDFHRGDVLYRSYDKSRSRIRAKGVTVIALPPPSPTLDDDEITDGVEINYDDLLEILSGRELTLKSVLDEDVKLSANVPPELVNSIQLPSKEYPILIGIKRKKGEKGD